MIIYKKGNLLESNCNIIIHQVNCKRAMGRGIAGQIRQKWPKVYEDYCHFIDVGYDNKYFDWSSNILGSICWTLIDENKYVVDFFSQDEYYPRDRCHTDYNAFIQCCWKLKRMLKRLNIEDYIIGFPYKIGCGLAGGDWSIISKIIEEELSDYNVEIWEYQQ